MSKNSLKNIIWDVIEENIKQFDNESPTNRLFNLINNHFLENKNRVLTYPQFIAYCMASLSGKTRESNIKDIFNNEVKGK